MGSYGSKKCTSCKKQFDWTNPNATPTDLHEIPLVCPWCGTVHTILSSYDIKEVFKSK